MERLRVKVLDTPLRPVSSQHHLSFPLRAIHDVSAKFRYAALLRSQRALVWSLTLAGVIAEAMAVPVSTPPSRPDSPSPEQAAAPSLFIREYRVAGAKLLTPNEVGEVVYPFLGPGRTREDVEGAREAIEKAYKEKGFQTVTVEVPQQTGRGGVIVLKVVENKVGRLRVKGSRYFSLEEIKRRAPSLAEGSVPNFNDITRDVIALNQWPDRKITPALRAGVEPGTVDIDLNVEDTFPLHGSVELNNRYSADTTELRLNGSISYNNLWQRGHSIGFSFQVAPQRPEDATIYSAYYLARFAELPWLTLMVLGTKQESDISTLGGVSVAAPGQSLGVRAGFTLPGKEGFFHSLTLGFDYKDYEENVLVGLQTTQTFVTYYPWSLAYAATLIGKGRVTELDAALNFHFRGSGDRVEFDNKRFGADTNYVYLRGSLEHTQEVPKGLQLYGRVQGQISSQPLLNSEQFAGGGLSTARGYLEAAVLGDNALFGTLELRSPSLLSWWGRKDGDWRVYAFVDAGFVTLRDPLPEQTSRFELASYGLGSRLKLYDHFNGSIDAGFPLVDSGETLAGDLLLTFRVSADF
jgi:hemolysin activation/secretion protein